jgi:poly-gamma-glutamate synthase PgsB/CapB
MSPTLVVAFAAAILLGRLVLERALIERAKARIPLRICVTGTRGKSSVTRLIAAGLRAGGRRVYAKTTGTEPALILPDGSEERVVRRGRASILEQGRLLRRSARGGAQAIVFEVMSIRPETQLVETGTILEPTILALTNARKDHLPHPAGTRSDVASMLSLSVPSGGSVHVAAEELAREVEEACEKTGAKLVVVAGSAAAGTDGLLQGFAYEEFEGNVRLALSVCEEAGVERRIALEGMRSVKPDAGRLLLSRIRLEGGGIALCASAFAANDPESTMAVLHKVESAMEVPARRVWIFNIRRDRGERTLQWIDFFASRRRAGEGPLFDSLAIVGDPAHSRAAAARIRALGLRAFYARGSDPEIITRLVAAPPDARKSAASDDSLREVGLFIFGFGNIAGAGRALAEYWRSKGAQA